MIQVARRVRSGFVVFNARNYPNFERLLGHSASPLSLLT
jgi:predicted NAD/FAD-binding protein